MKTISLSDYDLQILHGSLHYLHMQELKNICLGYGLPAKGNKVALMSRIITFITTGEIVQLPIMPAASKARSSTQLPLAPTTLMLYGAYKNDAKTRAFFKTLVGSHFHFTAYGIDWLNECWFAGKPPTYAEFAAFWQQEYDARKKTKIAPKKEWAYINFTQDFLMHYPDASHSEIIEAWKKERQRHVEKVMRLLQLQ